ncbi:MAG TPA: MBL fold metallo-hydrolase [Saprospiraceae bacterium]|nr:MBL fold metallo-hydrolase [Saprospiraceae bacterium]
MIRSLTPIPCGHFKLDGGAMFGVVPKMLWSKLNPPDEQNLCTWAMRCLMIETDERLILVDCGMGEKQDLKFRSYFHPHGNIDIVSAVEDAGFEAGAVTDVFLTHLHFDHCGGAVKKTGDGALVPAFPNARYWSNERHWDWAMNPNERERASFLKENFVPLQEHGVLHFIESEKGQLEWLPGISVRFLYGHTEAMMSLEIEFENRKYVYCCDLLPSSYHISMPYIMAYDVRPLVSLQEKEMLLKQAADHQHILILEHDPKIEATTVRYDERGRILADKSVHISGTSA